MKVLAINSSPHLDKGNTAMVLNPFLGGMKELGADVKTVYPLKMTIKPCMGCLKCWTKTPGACIYKDDVSNILPMIKEADVIVFATPIYWDGMSGLMKMFFDKMTPIGQPFIDIREDRSRHPVREGYGHGTVVLVSTCGYFEMENFDPLLSHIKAIAENLEREFAGALLRPNAQSIKPMMMMGMGDELEDIFKSAMEAGRELVRDGKMKRETLNTISRDIMPVEVFRDNANKYFTMVLDKLEKKVKGI